MITTDQAPQWQKRLRWAKWSQRIQAPRKATTVSQAAKKPSTARGKSDNDESSNHNGSRPRRVKATNHEGRAGAVRVLKATWRDKSKRWIKAEIWFYEQRWEENNWQLLKTEIFKNETLYVCLSTSGNTAPLASSIVTSTSWRTYEFFVTFFTSWLSELFGTTSCSLNWAATSTFSLSLTTFRISMTFCYRLYMRAYILLLYDCSIKQHSFQTILFLNPSQLICLPDLSTWIDNV